MKFKAPENVAELEGDKLAKSIEEALAALSEVSDEATDEELTEAEAVLAYVESARTEVTNREAAEQVRKDRLDAIKNASKQDKKEDAPAPEAPAEEKKEDAPPADIEVVEPPARELVDASASIQKLSATEKIAAQQEEVPPVKKEFPRATLVASAGNAEFGAGHKFASLAEAGPAILSSLQNLPSSRQENVSLRNSALQIKLPENEFTQGQSMDVSEMLQQVSKEARLSGKSLTAAGGWGAPSERSLDFCVQEELDGLLNLPEITVTHGGLTYTKGPTFASVLGSSTGFWDMTEATAEAGVEQKTSLRPAIPTFTEKRLDAVGVMMEAGLLLRAGWPELVERYAALALKAFQYKLNQKKITLLTGATGYLPTATAITNGFSNELDILHVIELVAEGERQRNFMSSTQTLEVIAPQWVRAAIRAGLAQRAGVDTITVTNAQIDSHFSARGVRVQWIRGWQELTLTSGIATTYPSNVEFIMYPAGTYVVGVAPVIKLDTIYDSVNLKKNDYVHLFVEQGMLMANPCGEGRRISVPMNINGRRAGVLDNNDNLFKAPVA